MLVVTDNVSVKNVPFANVANLRFDEVTSNAVIKMCEGTRVIASFTDEPVGNRLLSKIGQEGPTDSSRFILSPTDVAIVVVKIPASASVFAYAENHKCCASIDKEADVEVAKTLTKSYVEDNKYVYYRVTCRRDYEVFGFNSEFLILDRDGSRQSAVIDPEEHGLDELDALYAQCENLNK